ncbi:MAG: amidohydrolase family protein [Gemmatimonadetes bacterium]|nr:amidohydrolase family protein [Gemmatimonadota bacterium]
MLLRVLVLCGFTLTLASTQPASTLVLEPVGESVAIVHVGVIPMDSERVIEDQTVLVRGGEIAEIGPAADVEVPAGTLVVDGQGRFLIPGLADMHVHLGSDPYFHETILDLFWVHGVTTILDMGGTPDILDVRDRIRAGELEAPHLWVSSPAANDSMMDFETGRKYASEQLGAGYDFVKVYSFLSTDGFEGVAKGAQEVGIRLIGHLAHKVGLERSLAAGQEMIAHTEEYLYGHLGFSTTDISQPLTILDRAKIPEMVALASSSGVWSTSSLIAFTRILEFVEDPHVIMESRLTEYFPPGAREAWAWNEGSRYIEQFSTEAHQERLREALSYQVELLKALHNAGVPIIAGTDATLVGVLPGYSMHEELQLLVDAGLTPYEALATATRNPAAFLGIAETAGTLEEGKQADLLLLDGNPLEDIRHTTRIVGILLGGKWIPRERADRVLDDVLARNELEGDFYEILRTEGAETATALFLQARERDPSAILFSESALNGAGYGALNSADGPDEAIRIFKLNVLSYPESANVYDSLGEAHLKAGQIALAVENYEKAIALDPDGPVGRNSKRMLETIRAQQPLGDERQEAQ